jgi:hypothetical protein
MNRQLRLTAGTLALSIGLALPTPTRANPAEAAVTKAGIGLAAVGLAVAAPAVFVAVTAVSTVLMVRSIATGMQRHRGPVFERSELQPYPDAQAAASPFPAYGRYGSVLPQYEQGTTDASAFPVSTGMYGAVIVDGGK